VQLAFLGRIEEHEEAALELANFCFETLDVNRVIYVGGDDGLDRVVAARFSRLEPPLDRIRDFGAGAFWQRTTPCLDSPPHLVRTFVAQEQRLLSLMRLETIAENTANTALITMWQHFRVCAKLTQTPTPSVDDEIVVLGAQHRAQLPKSRQAPVALAPGSLSEAGLLVLRLGVEPTVTLDVELLNRHAQRQDHYHLHLWD
jgi:hypothetical protein